MELGAWGSEQRFFFAPRLNTLEADPVQRGRRISLITRLFVSELQALGLFIEVLCHFVEQAALPHE